MRKVFLTMMLTIGLISLFGVPVSANDYYTTTEHGMGH